MQDELDLLPSAPSELNANDEGSIKKAPPAPPLEVEEIQSLISQKLYYELASTNDLLSESEVVSTCIARAENLARNLLHLVKKPFTLYSKTQRLITTHLTVYELYLYNGDIEGAEKWLEKANAIIGVRYGSIEKAKNATVVVCSVTNRKG